MLADIGWSAKTSFSGILDSFRKMITQMVIQKQLGEPRLKLFTLMPGAVPAVIPSALGNVFDRGRLQAFAAGGGIDRPTFFPMAKGGLGLNGEAGPEAIVPLGRGGFDTSSRLAWG